MTAAVKRRREEKDDQETKPLHGGQGNEKDITTPSHLIYILGCMNNQTYVGRCRTDRLRDRLAEHFTGDTAAAEFTKIHRPVVVESTIPSYHPLDEDMVVLYLMCARGIDHVRGGSYCRINLRNEEKNILCRQLRHANGQCMTGGAR